MRVERKERDLSKVVIKRIYLHRGCVVSKGTDLLGDKNMFFVRRSLSFFFGGPLPFNTLLQVFSVVVIEFTRYKSVGESFSSIT